jgi:hypothetical protein
MIEEKKLRNDINSLDKKYIKLYGNDYLLIFVEALSYCTPKLFKKIENTKGVKATKKGIELILIADKFSIPIIAYNLHSLQQLILNSTLPDLQKIEVIEALKELKTLKKYIATSNQINDLDALGIKLKELAKEGAKEGAKEAIKEVLNPTKTTEKLSKKQQQDLDVKNLRTKRHLEAITKLALNNNKGNN